MMTEAEAKKKWCPNVRYLATFRNDEGKLETAGCFNRGGADSGLEKARCIGSDCMAWRWKYGEDRAYRGRDTQHGYCGAFGKP